MSDVLAKGGGHKGGLILACVPDSTFKSEIDALITAGTKVVGKLVQFTWSDNYEVTSPAAAATPDGVIVSYRKTTQAAGASYDLSVLAFHYADQNAVDHTPVAVVTLEYDGTTALQDSVKVDGATYRKVEDGGAAGWGAVISIDTSAVTVDVLV